MMIGGSNNNRKRPQRLLLLLLAMSAAVLGMMLLHKLREGRIFGLLLRDCDRQLLTMQVLLEKEREKSNKLKRNLEDMKATTSTWRTQKMALTDKLMESENTADQLRKVQKEMETAIQERQNQISRLTEQAEESNAANLQVEDLTERLKKKEAEAQDMKQKLMNARLFDSNTTHQDGPKEKDINSTSVEEIPREGQWVKFQTNEEDEGLKAEGNQVSEEQSMEKKPKVSKGSKFEGREVIEDQSVGKLQFSRKNEDSSERGEITQKSTLEAKEQGEGSTKGGMEGKEQEAHKIGTLEKLENSEDGNEHKEASREPKLAAESEEAKKKVGHHNKNKTKSRKRKIALRGRELEKHGNGHSEKSVNAENLSSTGENTDNNTVNDKYGSRENSENKETISNTSKLEFPESIEVNDESTKQHQSNHKGTADNDQQLVNSQIHEEDKSLKDQRDSLGENAQERKEKEVTYTERQSKKPENSQDAEAMNKRDSDVAGAAVDFIKGSYSNNARQEDGVSKEAAVATTTSNTEQTEGLNVVGNPQSQASEDKTEGLNVVGNPQSQVSENNTSVDDDQRYDGDDHKATLTEGQLEEPKNPPDDAAQKVKHIDDKAGNAADLIQGKEDVAEKKDETVQEEVDADTLSSKQTEAHSIVDDHPSQVPEDVTNSSDSSSVGEF